MTSEYSTPAADQALGPVQDLDLSAPVTWLRLGWQDLKRCPVPSLLHGLVMSGFGLSLFLLERHQLGLLLGAFSGFLLVAPVAATGLYALSRALEQGQPARLQTVIQVWLSFDARLVKFGMLLGLAGTVWVGTSTALITLLSPAPIHTPNDFLQHVLLAKGQYLFEIWMLLGGLMAAPIFASSVITLPMLLDHPQMKVIDAIMHSFHVVASHPVPMALWAFALMGLSMLGLATALLGLIVFVPLLGHASWHAYRGTIAPLTAPIA